MNVSAKFDILNNIEITSSESKGKLRRSEKGLVTALALKTKVRSKRYKKTRYAIGNVSMKDLLNIIKGLRKFLRYRM